MNHAYPDHRPRTEADEFHAVVRELRDAGILENAEALGTYLFTDEKDRARWEYLGKHPRITAESPETLTMSEQHIKKRVGFMLGRTVSIGANWHCQQDASGVWNETTEEYTTQAVFGTVNDVVGEVTTFMANYQRGFEPQGVQLPAVGSFAHYRIGLMVEATLVPLDQINGSSNKLRVL